MSAEMAETATINGNELVITRVFDAPRELVFRAWTDPDQLAVWWGPEHLHTPRETVEIDAREGGIWKATMVRDGTGEEYPSRGRFVRIREPELFELMEPPSEVFPFETRLLVTLEDLGGRTLMTLTSRMLTEQPTFEGVVEGWGTSLEKLRALLARQQAT